MAKLKLEKYNTFLSLHLSPLVQAGYIDYLDASNYGLGYIYYLKKKGALMVSGNIDRKLIDICFSKNTPRLSLQTLFHRTHAIDFHIESIIIVLRIICLCSFMIENLKQ